MQAIHVKYLSATNNRGSRIKAICGARSLTIGYPHELSGQAVYRKAAEMLVSELGWTGPNYGSLLGGCLPNGDYCFVMNNAQAWE